MMLGVDDAGHDRARARARDRDADFDDDEDDKDDRGDAKAPAHHTQHAYSSPGHISSSSTPLADLPSPHSSPPSPRNPSACVQGSGPTGARCSLC
eukprot:2751349-Rhodomonas_salina.1